MINLRKYRQHLLTSAAAALLSVSAAAAPVNTASFMSAPPTPVSTGRLGTLLAGLVRCGVAPTEEVKTAASDPLTRTGFFFDTVITISLYDTDDETILDACDALMLECENRLSRTRENSDIWNINHAKGKPVEVSEETISLIQSAIKYCELSDGAFDITIAPVVSLWDFHMENDPTVPDAGAIAEAVTHVDYTMIEIDDEKHTVALKDPEAGIDLGAIAKGYISDLLKEEILKHGSESALINLGGNVLAVGTKPDGSSWNIGIRRPFAESAYDLIAKVAVDDMSVITSGTYERYFEQDGVLYHHILDPFTGYSVNNGLTSVTILSKAGTDGDALSTTCFVLGPDKGMELIESLDGIEAMFVADDLTISYSSGWPQ